MWCLYTGCGVCTLVGVFSVMWTELLMTSAISCPLWSSVYECQIVECALTSPVRTECRMFVIYCMHCCMSVCIYVVHGCAVLRRYKNVCNCDMFSVVNVYLDHLKFCVVCINGCCCMPSETYGMNGATPIFRSFHRTASSTTGGWSRWNILMCFYISF